MATSTTSSGGRRVHTRFCTFWSVSIVCCFCLSVFLLVCFLCLSVFLYVCFFSCLFYCMSVFVLDCCFTCLFGLRDLVFCLRRSGFWLYVCVLPVLAVCSRCPASFAACSFGLSLGCLYFVFVLSFCVCFDRLYTLVCVVFFFFFVIDSRAPACMPTCLPACMHACLHACTCDGSASEFFFPVPNIFQMRPC